MGQTYTSTIRVLGFQGKEVRLVLTILPPTEMVRLARKAKPKKQTKATPHKQTERQGNEVTHRVFKEENHQTITATRQSLTMRGRNSSIYDGLF